MAVMPECHEGQFSERVLSGDRAALEERLLEGWRLLAEQNDPSGAEETIAPVIAANDPEFTPRAFYLAGLIREDAVAIDLFGKAFRSGEHDAAYPLGVALAHEHRFEEAAVPLRMAARDAGNAEAACVLLARVRLVLGDVESALTATSVALDAALRRRSAPEGTYLSVGGSEWFQLAVLLHEQGQGEASAACFEECALTGDPAVAETAAANARALTGRTLEADSPPAGG